jgi:hypothetical protein
LEEDPGYRSDRATQHVLNWCLIESLGGAEFDVATNGRQTVATAAAQAAAFYREVAQHGSVWTIRDAGGFPQPRGIGGVRTQPFWSLRSRADRVVATVPTYAGFDVVELPWQVFEADWVPGLTRDGVLVGVNWAGPDATGYDAWPEDVVRNVEGARDLQGKIEGRRANPL